MGDARRQLTAALDAPQATAPAVNDEELDALDQVVLKV